VPSFLVSFVTPDGSSRSTYGSHVLNLPEPPSTSQAAEDLRITLGMQYSASTLLLVNWDLLPEADAHPCASRPYPYLVTFQASQGPGSLTYLRTHPILTLDDLRQVEDWISSLVGATNVHIVACKPLRETYPSLVEEYRETERRGAS
jgi:hypothetical protein